MNQVNLLHLAGSALLAFGLVACGPNQVHLDPRNVTTVTLKTPTSEATFCPGEPLRLELRAGLKDGSTCSNTDALNTTCMGEQGAVIDAADVRVQGTAGAVSHADGAFLWMTPRDAMITAERGLSLRGWIESATPGAAPVQSPVGELQLRPVYSCLQESTFTLPPSGSPGQNGLPGPDLKVSATLILTPFYPEALLVRVELATGRTYIIATDRSKPITILSKGQNGSAGARGRNGSNGPDGMNGSSLGCEQGKPGHGGSDGTAGGNGGNGGPGGMVQLFLDEAVAAKIQGWLKVGSLGGEPGAGGQGGAGGLGGHGGQHSDNPGCQSTDGQTGRSGMGGSNGDVGRPGANGPEATVAAGNRQALFGADLPVIQHLESVAKAKQ